MLDLASLAKLEKQHTSIADKDFFLVVMHNIDRHLLLLIYNEVKGVHQQI
jgi:hypothetical protein